MAGESSRDRCTKECSECSKCTDTYSLPREVESEEISLLKELINVHNKGYFLPDVVISIVDKARKLIKEHE